MTLPGILLFGISGGEILMLILLVLLLFGPRKIPEIARMLGKGLGEVRKVQREINSEIHRYSSEVEGEAKKMESDIKKEVEAFKNTPGTESPGNDKQSPEAKSAAGESDDKSAPKHQQDDEELPEAYKRGEESKKASDD